ncbi:hypothetical protein [Streptomyces sp. DH37]|uniref:hypothetical protein n=1 Tax=Streptomyces sp. DH37 TaxID=3040122 RepID=UPI00244352B0|nr:hypothetical protein [Streptomyces sp. DH37]MDG9704645.1 hypothetical protein [Streptomyces sp. DH37]
MPGRRLLGPPVAAAGDTAGGTAPDPPRAVLLGLNRREGMAPDGADPGQGPDVLDERENPAQTDGIAVVGRLVQTRAHPGAVRVSALTGEGTDGLRQAVRARLQRTGGE